MVLGDVGSGKSSLLSTILGEMIYLPDKEIDYIGDRTRKISSSELKALEHNLFQEDFSADLTSPVGIAGTLSYVEG